MYFKFIITFFIMIFEMIIFLLVLLMYPESVKYIYFHLLLNFYK